MNQPETFPSIRAHIGDIDYYVTTMTFGAIARWIKRPDKTKETDQDFKTWLQREINKNRLKKIADYLAQFDQRFFNAIVVGIFDGDPQWYPVSVSTTPNLADIELSEQTRTAMGVLLLLGGEEAFPIDGQHRVEAIKDALRRNRELENDELAVLFVSHKPTKEGRERTRRLFTTLNKYAKPVSQGEIVALDEDDAFAIVTRRLMDADNALKGFISFTKTANLVATDKIGITSTVALYQLIQYLPLPRGCGSIASLKVGPAERTQKQIESIYDQQITFWNCVTQHIPEIKQVTESSPSDELAGTYRIDGGHILFRPAGQHAFAKAIKTMVQRGHHSMEQAIEVLSHAEMQLENPPWPHVLWNSSDKTMLVKYTRLAQNLLLYMANEQPATKDYDLLVEYRRRVDDPNASLDGIKKAPQVV